MLEAAEGFGDRPPRSGPPLTRLWRSRRRASRAPGTGLLHCRRAPGGAWQSHGQGPAPRAGRRTGRRSGEGTRRLHRLRRPRPAAPLPRSPRPGHRGREGSSPRRAHGAQSRRSSHERPIMSVQSKKRPAGSLPCGRALKATCNSRPRSACPPRPSRWPARVGDDKTELRCEFFSAREHEPASRTSTMPGDDLALGKPDDGGASEPRLHDRA